MAESEAAMVVLGSYSDKVSLGGGVLINRL